MAADKFSAANDAILSALDVRLEYQSMGVRFVGEPRSSGMISCYAIGRDDRHPSAFVNCRSGYYGDSGGSDGAAPCVLSLWDFAVKFGGQPDWQTARREYATKAGIKLGRGGRTSKSKEKEWRDKLEFQSWDAPGNMILAERWCRAAKPGVTVESILAAGGRLAYYPCFRDEKTDELRRRPNHTQVIALPCWGERLLDSDPVAWVVWDATGADLEIFRGKGNQPDRVKMQSVGPTGGTFLGLHGLSRLVLPDLRERVEVDWKVEGPTDMMAAWAAIPPERRDVELVVTNGGGATSDVAAWQVALLAGIRVNVLHDADVAGEMGAMKWARALHGASESVHQVRLSEEIADKHGLDLRDWLSGGKGYSDLVSLAADSAPWSPPTAQQEVVADAKTADTSIESEICRALEIDVLGRLEDGSAKVYSMFHRRSAIIRKPGMMNYADFLQLCGPPAKAHVIKASDKEEVPGMWGCDQVRSAIQLLAGYRTLSDEIECGPGCWQAVDADGREVDSVVVVGPDEAAIYNGHLERISHPRAGGLLLDFGATAKRWYDYPTLERYLGQAADQGFRQGVFGEAMELFDRWRWQHQKSSSIVLVGLCLATWVQHLWSWRPQVAIVGPSKAGKTMFGECLSGIYRHNCLFTSDTTAAGLRQELENSMRAVVVDEGDPKDRGQQIERQKILTMIRQSSRGGIVLRGTSNQKSSHHTLRHIFWVFGIQLPFDQEADRNRVIMLNLELPEKDKEGQLQLPSAEQLAELGQRMLAVALWSARAARNLAVTIRDYKMEGIDSRLVESYSVPAAMLSVLYGFDADPDAVRQLLGEMLADVDADMVPVSTADSLIHEILSSKLQIASDRFTVAQLLEIVEQKGTGYDEAAKALAGCGLKLDWDDQSHRVIMLQYQPIKKHLLRGTQWEGSSIDQILRTVQEATPVRVWVGGIRNRGISIGWDLFCREYLEIVPDAVKSAF